MAQGNVNLSDLVVKPRFGTFAWVDYHIKGLFIALMLEALAFITLMLLYVIYLFGFSRYDMSNRYMSITTLVFSIAAMLNIIVGIVGLSKKWVKMMNLFNVNNFVITFLSTLLSGIHFAKGVYSYRDVTEKYGLTPVFFATAVAYLFMAIDYGMMIYLLHRLRTKKPIDPPKFAADFKTKDSLILIHEDLNATCSTTHKDSVNIV